MKTDCSVVSLSALVLACAFSLSANAAVREVGPGKAYAMIQGCQDAASPGDICRIYAGTYSERVVVTKSIMFAANDGNMPRIIGGFDVGSTPNVQIQRLEITGWGRPDAGSHGIQQLNGSGLTVAHCVIHDGYGAAVYSRNSTRLTVAGNETYRVKIPKKSDTVATGDGMYILSAHSSDSTYAAGTHIEKNVIHDNQEDGIKLHGQYFSVSANQIYNNIDSNWATSHPDGIQVNSGTGDGYRSVQHAIFSGNTIRNHTQNLFVDGGRGSWCVDVAIYNNVLFNDSGVVNGVPMDVGTGGFAAKNLAVGGCRDVWIYNNTFGRANSDSVRVSGSAAGSVHIKNNIFANPQRHGLVVTDLSISDGELDYNHYFTPQGQNISYAGKWYATLAAFKSAVPSQETHGHAGDPLLADWPTPMPLPGSPVIGAGIALPDFYRLDASGILRPQGAAWAIGAYEAVKSSPFTGE